MVVTANVGDFITLAKQSDLHPGVIALREAELRAEAQWQRLQTALKHAEQDCNGDLTNAVLEVQSAPNMAVHPIPDLEPGA